MGGMNEHLVSLGFHVDPQSYNQMVSAITHINTLVSHMASHIVKRIGEAGLSLVGLDKEFKKIRATLHKVIAPLSGGSSGHSGGGSGPSGGSPGTSTSMQAASAGLKTFAASAMKYFGEASVAVAAFGTAVAAGTVSMLDGLGQQEIQMEMLARTMWTTQRQAYAFSLSLKVLGANLQDLYLSPTLLAQYQKLHAAAMQMQTPGNYRQAVGLVQSVSLQFKQLQLEAYYALQWIGYYFIKYMSGPITNVKNVLQSINAVILKQMPTWTRKVAAVMASFVQAGIYIWDALDSVYKYLVKLASYIPGWAKAVAAGLALISISNPFGLIAEAIAAAILVLDDFETYLHGGKSAFGGFWGWLVKLAQAPAWTQLNDSLQLAGQSMTQVSNALNQLFGAFSSGGNRSAISSFGTLISDVITAAVKDIALGISEISQWVELNVAVFSGNWKGALSIIRGMGSTLVKSGVLPFTPNSVGAPTPPVHPGHKHTVIHAPQHVHIHTDSPHAAAAAVTRSYNRHLHNIRGVIG